MLLALAQTKVPATAVVVVNPVARAADVIAAGERIYGTPYRWTDESRAKSESLDFVRRAGEIAARAPQPPILIVQGEEDDGASVTAAGELHDALRNGYQSPGKVELLRVPGLPHALADEPGFKPAPQTPGAATVDAAVTEWLRRHLT